MKTSKYFLFCLVFALANTLCFSQEIIEYYEPVAKDSLRIGSGANDFLPFIQKGYTLMKPAKQPVQGVLVLLEDSGYDQKNKSSKQLYTLASENGFAVLTVSTEIPFDFYFTTASMQSTHELIRDAFHKHNLPNENIFFLGASLVGHRAMRYIKFMKEGDFKFKLQIQGLVMCNFTLDFTRKWHQHKRDIRINRINLWEPTFINYMLETYLQGTPKTAPERYHDFSAYSYFDEKNRNIKIYKDYTVRVYIEPAIKYRLKTYFRTLYENNATDMVGFLAELELAGNSNTELIVLQPEDNTSPTKTTQSTWDAIDKNDLMEWILSQTKE